MAVFFLGSDISKAQQPNWPQYESNPKKIPLHSEFTDGDSKSSGRDGIIVGDVNGDGLMDFVVVQKDNPVDDNSTAARMAAYDNGGRELWFQNISLTYDSKLLGSSSANCLIGDVDGDGANEVCYLDTKGRLVIRSGSTGELETSSLIDLGRPSETAHWGALALATLNRDQPDRAIIVQGTGKARKQLKAIRVSEDRKIFTLWSIKNYVAAGHNPLRVTDLDLDGKDEVLGGNIIDDDSTTWTKWNQFRDFSSYQGEGYWHIDSISAADIDPDRPGLEIAACDELGQSSTRDEERWFIADEDDVFVVEKFGREGPPSDENCTVCSSIEPQNIVIGDFAPDRPGLEIWMRSRHNSQTPWVSDSSGNVISTWEMKKVKPPGWTTSGVEMIQTINWEGGSKKFAAAKERHTQGDVGIFDAMSGRFIWSHDEQARNLLVADVSGDYREEIIVLILKEGELRIYWNEDSNEQSKPRLWADPNYRRLKQTRNYYSN